MIGYVYSTVIFEIMLQSKTSIIAFLQSLSGMEIVVKTKVQHGNRPYRQIPLWNAVKIVQNRTRIHEEMRVIVFVVLKQT